MSEIGREMQETFVKQLREKGHRVELDTPFCNQYKDAHGNCKGCESERGCQKLIDLLMMMATVTMAKHDTPEQIEHNANWMRKKMEEIFDVKDSTV